MQLKALLTAAEANSRLQADMLAKNLVRRDEHD